MFLPEGAQCPTSYPPILHPLGEMNMEIGNPQLSAVYIPSADANVNGHWALTHGRKGARAHRRAGDDADICHEPWAYGSACNGARVCSYVRPGTESLHHLWPGVWAYFYTWTCGMFSGAWGWWQPSSAQVVNHQPVGSTMASRPLGSTWDLSPYGSTGLTLAVFHPSTPLALSGFAFPLVLPWSSVAPESPQSTGILTPPQVLVTADLPRPLNLQCRLVLSLPQLRPGLQISQLHPGSSHYRFHRGPFYHLCSCSMVLPIIWYTLVLSSATCNWDFCLPLLALISSLAPRSIWFTLVLSSTTCYDSPS